MDGKKSLLCEATWIFSDESTPQLLWGRDQAIVLASKLCGRFPHTAAIPKPPLSIIVGSPEKQSLIRKAAERKLLDLETIGADDYRILSTSMDGNEVILIAGRNDAAALHGLFAFFEALGCRFLLSGDVLPDLDPDLEIPHLDITGRTHSPWRAVWIGFCFATIGMLSLSNYEHLFTQMAKMRMNRVIYYLFENEPFMDYVYQGERKIVGDVSYPESACMSLGRQDTGSYRVADMTVGKEKFDRAFVAPMEFQHARTSVEMLDAGRAFMQDLIRMAAQRGLGTWISFDSTFVSLNMTKYTRRMARPSECYGALTSFTDPVVTDINRKRIEFITEAYPDIEGMLIQITEGAYEDPHPESQAVIDREWPKYQEAYSLMQKHWGNHWVGEKVQRTYMRADIGFVERMKRSLEAAREIAPNLKLGVLTVCKAYLLTHLHEVLPKDLAFVDIEAQSLWTVDGAPLHLFQRMKGRECVLVPRAYDDGSLAGLQFNLKLYQRDGFLASRKQNSTCGLAIQISHLTGNDHNFRFLANGMWNEDSTPDTFYRDYATTSFGAEAAEPICEALRILEDNEEFMGGRGNKNLPYNLNPLELHMIRAIKPHRTPFLNAPWTLEAIDVTFSSRQTLYRQSMRNLEIAQRLLQRGLLSCRSAGKFELNFLINKTDAYRSHLQTLCMIPDVLRQTIKAFCELDAGRHAACRNQLAEACSIAWRTEQNAIDAARRFAACSDHPTDLAVTWALNHIVTGARVLRQYLSNVVAFHNGREYWCPVDWHLFFGESPFPTYSVEGADTMVFG